MSRKFEYSSVLTKLRPASSWSMVGNKYEDIVWLDPNSECPTKEELDAELLALQSAYDALEYQRRRVAEYPTIAEQLDMIYHDGIDAWKASISEIKNKYPKP